MAKLLPNSLRFDQELEDYADQPKLQPDAPKLTQSQVLDAEVVATKERLDTKFAKDTKVLLDVMCPGCGTEFAIEVPGPTPERSGPTT